MHALSPGKWYLSKSRLGPGLSRIGNVYILFYAPCPHKMTKNCQHFEIVPVRGRRTLDKFIRLPWRIYRDDPAWIPPLILERRLHLADSNPYFKHADCRFWLALKDGAPAGRISAQIDSLYLERYRDATGFWGMIEGEDNFELFRLLLETAEQWLRARGMKRAMGPFNLSINQECGLLTKGFDTPPSMMMGHAKPWYEMHIADYGYEKIMDLLAYTISSEDELPPVAKMLLKTSGNDVQSRPVDMSRLEDELDIMFSIFNDAWSENWGFIPFTRAEYIDMGKSLRFIARKELIRIAEIGGNPAGFIVVLPNLNEIIRDLDGRLLPFGWIRLIYRLRIKGTETGRILLMGVRRQYRDTLAGAAVAYALFSDINRAVRKLGMKRLELSWILENNKIMRSIIEALGARHYKTYRIFSRDI